jgi:hypothetical protein
LFTDADCTLLKGWITAMSSQFTTEKLLLGYGGYEKIEKSFLNKLIRLRLYLQQFNIFHGQKQDFPIWCRKKFSLKKRRVF